jgi:hypothetical protein
MTINFYDIKNIYHNKKNKMASFFCARLNLFASIFKFVFSEFLLSFCCLLHASKINNLRALLVRKVS